VEITHTPRLHQAQHLLEMDQLLTRQPGHLAQQIRMVHIAEQQRHGGGSGFFLTMGVIGEQHRLGLRFRRQLEPLRRRCAAKKFLDFAQGIHPAPPVCTYKRGALYQRSAYPSTAGSVDQGIDEIDHELGLLLIHRLPTTQPHTLEHITSFRVMLHVGQTLE